MPAVCLSEADNKALMEAVEADPTLAVSVDVAAQEVRCGDTVYPAEIPEGVRKQLIEGTWDATAVLLEAGEDIEAQASSIPYVQGF